MKKSILAILLCFCVTSYTAVPKSHAFMVYQKLVAFNDVSELSFRISYSDSPSCSLACTNGTSYILVTPLMLSMVKNDDELAAVIGHEMAHAIYRNEVKADLLGLEYAKRAGYSRCRAAQFLKNLKGDDEHPDGSIRYKNTGCP